MGLLASLTVWVQVWFSVKPAACETSSAWALPVLPTTRVAVSGKAMAAMEAATISLGARLTSILQGLGGVGGSQLPPLERLRSDRGFAARRLERRRLVYPTNRLLTRQP